MNNREEAMEVGNRIRKFRTELGFNQDELAEKIYVSRQTISNWENNKSYPDQQMNPCIILLEVHM